MIAGNPRLNRGGVKLISDVVTNKSCICGGLKRHNEENRRMSTVPYHTNSPEYPPKHREVYHDKDTCPDGKRIKPEHKESGTGGKQHCKEC